MEGVLLAVHGIWHLTRIVNYRWADRGTRSECRSTLNVEIKVLIDLFNAPYIQSEDILFVLLQRHYDFFHLIDSMTFCRAPFSSPPGGRVVDQVVGTKIKRRNKRLKYLTEFSPTLKSVKHLGSTMANSSIDKERLPPLYCCCKVQHHFLSSSYLQ
jgi:hypothetical protein